MRTSQALLSPLKSLLIVATLAAAATSCDTDPAGTVSATSSASATSSVGAGAAGGAGGGGAGAGGTGGGSYGELYEFESRFDAEKSSVSYAGQTLRHVLIEDLKAYIGGLTKAIDDDTFSPADVKTTVAALEYFYAFDGQTAGKEPIGLTTTPATLQNVYDDISTKKNLKDKLAGNDTATDHVDWSTTFVGWKDASIAAHGGSITSPEGLLLAFFGTLGKLALDRENGTIPNEPGTQKALTKVYVTADGLDFQQLIQKHLVMSVAYSQGTDDYLDDEAADAGKGLLSPNTRDGVSAYTVLEHAWDEAFGYFGAARDFALYTDKEIASAGGRPDWQGSHDTNGDGKIDLTQEYIFGAASNAAKRDLGAKEPTDFTRDAFAAAHAGRALIGDAGEVLTADELTALRGHRDAWVAAWERAIAATVIHYVNKSIGHTQALGTASYDFYAHAKAWSELKGFALGLQYNPRAKLSTADFAKLHDLVGDRPVLVTAAQSERDGYVTKLIEARETLRKAYGFSLANAEGW